MASNALQVILVGFPAPEKATFETFFRLVSSRRPGPLSIASSPAQANLILWNADSESARPSVLPGAQLLISVSKQPVEGSWRHVSRPVNLNAVLQNLDAAFAELNIAPATPVANAPLTPAAPVATLPARPVDVSALPSAPVPANAPPLSSAPRVVPMTRPVRTEPAVSTQPSALAPTRNSSAAKETPVVSELRSLARPASQISPIQTQKPAELVVSNPPVANTTTAKPINILVVDDSDVALRFMHSRLSAFGFAVDLCASGEEALVKVADGEYAFVFLDVMMEGLDGYQTCKAIKGRKYPASKSPTVVMLTSRGGTIDKVRGTFAGCDAYLTKPLDEAKMLKVLLRFSPDLADSVSTLGQARGTPPASSTRGSGNPLSASFENLPPGAAKQSG